MKIEIPNRFTPRPYQVPFMRYLDNHPKGGRAAWALHRRAGKDYTAMHQACKMAFERVGTYWHIYPTAEQGRRSIWTGFTRDGERIMEQVFPSAVRRTPKAFSPGGEMIVELKNGSIWRLMGSDKMEVVGAGPLGVVFSEYALSKPKTWEYVRPMLRETNGWAAFVSTVRGKNHFWDIWKTAEQEGWFRDLKTVYDTGLTYGSTKHPGTEIGPDEMMAEERADGMADAMVRQEYLCDWTAADVGSVYGELMEALEKAGAIAEFRLESPRVFTSWDLGGAGAKGDATAVWIWAANEDGVDLIDYFEGQGKPLDYYHDEVAARLDRYGLQAIKHWLPHDAAATYLTGQVFEQTQQRFGPARVAIGPKRGRLDGIQAARWLLQRKVRIHPRCSEGVLALKAYHYVWDADRKVLSNEPEHDWSSHGADAFRYLACVAKFSEEVTRPKPPEPPVDWTRKPTFRDALRDMRRTNPGRPAPWIPPEEGGR